MKNLSRTNCYAPAFRSATRNEAAYAAQPVREPTRTPNLNQDLHTFLQNLTHTTAPCRLDAPQLQASGRVFSMLSAAWAHASRLNNVVADGVTDELPDRM